jgi:hypothetical protein
MALRILLVPDCTVKSTLRKMFWVEAKVFTSLPDYH